MDTNARLHALQEQLVKMKDYIQMRLDLEDWHGVMDASADIRELVVQIDLLKEMNHA